MSRVLFVLLLSAVIFCIAEKLNCGPNEIQDSCPSDCQRDNCPRNLAESKLTSCESPKVCPPPKCKCIFNYRRAQNGTCISVFDCPPFECKGVNEEYRPCPSYCPGESCSSATSNENCPYILGVLPLLNCNPTCHCIKHYWRKNGVCVPYSECG